VNQLKIMLQNLVRERFGLTLHHESKEAPVYFLVVGKNGPKLTKAAEALDQVAPGPVARDKDGYFDLPPGAPDFVGLGTNGSVRVSARMQTMVNLADKLGLTLDRPVLDKTGLAGSYDFKLGYADQRLRGSRGGASTEASDPEPDLSDALQRQLGLKLESGNELLDFLVVDSANKIPTEN
jgi:uncharacterized protein (TIGR03435 family)